MALWIQGNGAAGRGSLLVRRLIDQGLREPRVLAELGYGNVQLRVGDGALGWPEAAPFDAILVSAAPYEVPPALLDQLAPGGRLVLPVGPSPEQQELQLWRRVPSGRLEKRGLMQVRFVPLTGSSQRSVH